MEVLKNENTGAWRTGMAGHTISLYLHEQGFDVTTFSRRPFKYCKNINGDVTNKDFVISMLLKGNYDVVINCIGILNQDESII